MRLAPVILLLCLVACGQQGGKQGGTYWVAKGGDDAAACTASATACATIQGAVKRIPWGGVGVINVGRGVYDEPVDIAHRTFVYVSGDCRDHGAVVLEGRTAGQSVLWVQDRTTAIIECLTITAAEGASGVNGIMTRQF